MLVYNFIHYIRTYIYTYIHVHVCVHVVCILHLQRRDIVQDNEIACCIKNILNTI